MRRRRRHQGAGNEENRRKLRRGRRCQGQMVQNTSGIQFLCRTIRGVLCPKQPCKTPHLHRTHGRRLVAKRGHLLLNLPEDYETVPTSKNGQSLMPKAPGKEAHARIGIFGHYTPSDLCVGVAGRSGVHREGAPSLGETAAGASLRTQRVRERICTNNLFQPPPEN
eukprot:gene877-biopygen9240